MTLDVPEDEWAEGQHRQLLVPGVVERRANDLRTEALTLEAPVDLRMQEGDLVLRAAIGGEPGELPVVRDLEALLGGVVLDGDGYCPIVDRPRPDAILLNRSST